MGYNSFILGSGVASWLVPGWRLVFCCSREAGELLASESRTSCATKFMSLLLYGQEKQELITMHEHEAKAMVGASTKFSQCVHACMNQSVCRSCYIILLVFFLELNVISTPFGVRVVISLPYDDMAKLNNNNSSLCLC